MATELVSTTVFFPVKTGPTLKRKRMHAIFQKKRQKTVKKGQNIWKFGQKCTNFENVLKKGK